MLELEPACVEMMNFYRVNFRGFSEIADGCETPRFSTILRRDLSAYLPDSEALQIVEVATRMGDFGNGSDLSMLRKSVSRNLKRRGVALPRGKRTAPGLREIVARLTPILLFYGIPLATGERSKLVRILQMITLEMEIHGDPRDELRRLAEKGRHIKDADAALAESMVAEARRHLAPSDVHRPANITLQGKRVS